MNKRSSRLILCAAFGALAGGCVSPTPQLDSHFGESVRMARAQMTLNPDASRDTDPVAGIDGKAAEKAMGRYEKSFQEPPPVTNVINIGGSLAGGGSGSGK